MKKAILIVLMLITAMCLGFGVYLLIGEIRHQKLLKEYPVSYTKTISACAEEFEQDPYLVLAMILCESSLDADAVSNRGAIGLMQIMPDTGEWIAHKLKLDDSYRQEQLYEPAVNIRFGCWYLQFLNNRFQGKRMEIIAAYNAGHKTVEKWLEDPQYTQDGSLTAIPYESTAAYYNRVIAAYGQYKVLYPDLFMLQDDATVVTQAPAVLY